MCVFVVPSNSPVLLEMPDTATLKLINVNIDCIQPEVAQCKTNSGNVKEANITQETHVVEKGCANTDADSNIKHSANSQNDQENVNKVTNYFFSSANEEADKRKSIELMKEVHNTIGDVFNGIWCFKGHFLYSSNQIANCIRNHQGMWHMHYKNHLRMS